MQITAEMDTRQLESTLEGWEKKQLPFAVARGLTQTAGLVKQALRGSMETSFDDPTPFTLNSLYVKPATKAKLVAEVGIKNMPTSGGTPQSSYLEPEVQGGTRPMKRMEYLFRQNGLLKPGMMFVPGQGAKLDRYGNMAPSMRVQILSALKLFDESQFSRPAKMNQTTKSRKRNKKALDLFVGSPGGGKEPAGVYQRVDNGDGTHSVKPLLIFVSKANYKPRLKMQQVATEVYQADFAAVLDKSLRDALVLQPFIGGG